MCKIGCKFNLPSILNQIPKENKINQFLQKVQLLTVGTLDVFFIDRKSFFLTFNLHTNSNIKVTTTDKPAINCIKSLMSLSQRKPTNTQRNIPVKMPITLVGTITRGSK